MIDDYAFGRVLVNGTEFTKDVIVHGEGITPWWRETGHSVTPKDLAALEEAKPEVIVLGTGAHGMMRVPRETRESLESRGIRVVAEATGEAVKTYNRLSEKGADVAIAMHLTC